VVYRLLFVVLLSLLEGASSLAQDLPRGAIVDKVVCKANVNQSYALYVPAGYAPDRKWPIVYALDPGARGRMPVERFKEAAEQLGFIVVGSNNSRNGPFDVSQAAIAAMVVDTRARFSVDTRRVYATGFSGGARAAVVIGLAMGGQVAGVIGFGAGFPAGSTPSSSVPFAYFGAAGTDDFNYAEMVALDRALDGFRTAHRFEVFEGGHDWPPPSICLRALGWMEVQSMKSGLQPKDQVLVDRIFDRAMADALAEERAGRSYIALSRYQGLAREFSGLRDVSACEEKAKALARASEVKQGLAALKESVAVQDELNERVRRLIVEALTGEDTFMAGRELLAELDNLKRKSVADKRPADRMAARRVLTSSWIWFNEGAAEDRERRQFARAADRYRFMTRIRPENAHAEYNLACALALAGNRKDAIEALRRAVAKGLADADAIEKDPDLASLRAERAFGQVIEMLRKGAGKSS
jgi:predicted esterase